MADYQNPRNMNAADYHRLDDDQEMVRTNKKTTGAEAHYYSGSVEFNNDHKPYAHPQHFESKDGYGETEYFEIDEAEDRKGFIAKVYGIISVQLVMTAVIALLALASGPFGRFLLGNTWVFILSLVGALVVQIILF